MISFAETKLFARMVVSFLSDGEYALLRQALVSIRLWATSLRAPAARARCRWGAPGRGKRGGFGSSTSPDPERQIWMLRLYPENVADSIPAHVLRHIKERSVTKATAKARGQTRDPRRSARAEAMARGRPVALGQRSLCSGSSCERAGQSQVKFASLLGVYLQEHFRSGNKVDGRHQGPRAHYCMVAAKNPQALLEVA